ncbi:MAG: hypothetical protein M5U14_18885 [Acidimicrobiia bacterium]|nr:hypothetical protein [Acidimicrobiia bacterium]
MARSVLRSVSPDATPEEVAAIVAALAVVEAEQQAAAAAGAEAVPEDRLDAWVEAARLSARRAGYLRGTWRLSGRIGRRTRA